MQDRVDLRGANDAGQHVVGRVDPDELGPLERHPRLARVDPDDHVDDGCASRYCARRLPQNVPSPVTRMRTGPPQPRQTLWRARSMSKSACWIDAG